MQYSNSIALLSETMDVSANIQANQAKQWLCLVCFADIDKPNTKQSVKTWMKGKNTLMEQVHFCIYDK